MNNYLRITSGDYRGRRILTPGGATHPMGERERLALFNMIAEYLSGASVLDLYAGSGALGIEAVSRGALEVVFVEKNREACDVIKRNLEELGVHGKVVKRGVAEFIQETEEAWDVVLADPPYDKFDLEEIEEIPSVTGKILVLSHPGEAPEIPGLNLVKSRSYAGATISVYSKG